jgi:nitrite reductase/ring-hydroxylating ferredoxin subunit
MTLASSAKTPKEMAVLCKTSDINPGECRRVEIAGHSPLAVFNVDGRFFVTDDTCTHGQASLCDGLLEGMVVECPFHAGTFDVSTGEALSYPAADPLKTYAVRIDGGDLVVDLDLAAH